MIGPATAWGRRVIPDLSTCSDRDFFLDARRRHRLRVDEPGVVAAVRRDGAIHRFEQSNGILEDQHEAFAAEIFELGERYMKAAAEHAKPRRRSIFEIFSRRRANAD